MSSVANLQKQERLDVKPFKRTPKPRKRDRVDLQRPLAKPTKGVGHSGPRKKPYKTKFSDIPTDVQAKIFGHAAAMPQTNPRSYKMLLRATDIGSIPSTFESRAPGGMHEVARLASTSKSFHEPLSKLMGGTAKPNNFGRYHEGHQARTLDRKMLGSEANKMQDIFASFDPRHRRGSRAAFGFDARTKRYGPLDSPRWGLDANNRNLLDSDYKAKRARAKPNAIDTAKRQTNTLMKRIGNPNRAVSRQFGGDNRQRGVGGEM